MWGFQHLGTLKRNLVMLFPETLARVFLPSLRNGVVL